MHKHILLLLSLLVALFTLSACGGGGSSGTTYTKAIVKIELTGTLPPSTAITGAGFTITLPTNVTPALTGSNVASTVVTLTGTFAGGTQLTPQYSPATTTTKGTLFITPANIVDPGVTIVGEVLTITLQLASGATPAVADFGTLSNLSVIDASGNTITGMGAKVASVTLQ